MKRVRPESVGALVVAILGSLLALGVLNVPTAGATDGAIAPAGAGFVSLSPVRALDTRTSGSCVNGVRNLAIAGKFGVPSNAGSVVLNVTAVGAQRSGYVTVYPTGASRPLASSLNFPATQVVPNHVTAKLGTGGAISLYTNAGCPHLVVDIAGYYRSGSASGGGFTGITPKRLFDSRERGYCVSAREAITLTNDPYPEWPTELGDRYAVSVPEAVTGLVYNVTVTGAKESGHISLGRYDEPSDTSSLNYAAGQTIANAVFHDGNDGYVETQFFTNRGCPHLIVDLVGYFVGGNGTGGVIGANPTRLLDTRVTGRCVNGVTKLPMPSGIDSVMLNVTVTRASNNGYLTVYPGPNRPLASNLNYVANQTVPNFVTTKVGSDDTISIFANSGCPHVIVDIVGAYFDDTVATGATNLSDFCIIYPNGAGCGGFPLEPTLWLDQVSAFSTGTSVKPSDQHACFVMSGSVRCAGELGGFEVPSSPLPNLTAVTKLAIGNRHGCAIQNAELWCWGFVSATAQGANFGWTPQKVTAMGTPVDVAASRSFVCVVNTDGEVWCQREGAIEPLARTMPARAVAIAAAYEGVCATLVNNEVWCFGRPGGGFGEPVYYLPQSALPAKVDGLVTDQRVAMDGAAVCAVTLSDTVQCVGSGYFGGLGVSSVVGSWDGTLTPVNVANVANVVQVNSSEMGMCARTASGRVFCWNERELNAFPYRFF